MRKISYKKLWKLLIDMDINKQILAERAGISTSTLTNMAKYRNVNTESLVKICDTLNCDIYDIMELVPDEDNEVNGQVEADSD